VYPLSSPHLPFGLRGLPVEDDVGLVEVGFDEDLEEDFFEVAGLSSQQLPNFFWQPASQ
jgi:hypothetical protein